jgi:general secretion pathway protein M
MKQYFETLILWHQGLPQRDKILVNATSIIVIVTLFYLLVWEPVHHGLEQQRQQYESQQNIVRWMQDAATEVKALKRSGAKAVTTSNQPVSLLIEKTAMVSGLKDNFGKLESSGNDGARVTLNTAPFNQILIWLNNLEKQHGISITSANIERAKETGTIDARLSFSRS